MFVHSSFIVFSIITASKLTQTVTLTSLKLLQLHCSCVAFLILNAGPTSHDLHALLSKQPTVAESDVMQARNLYLRASGWDLVGHTTLSLITLRQMLRTYGKGGWTIDVLAGMCKLAQMEYKSSTFRVKVTTTPSAPINLFASSSSSSSTPSTSEMIRTSESLIVNGIRTLIAAKRSLVSLTNGGIDPIRLWSTATCALLFEAALLRCEYSIAKVSLERMAELHGVNITTMMQSNGHRHMSTLSDVTHVVYVDIQIRWLEYLVAVGEEDQAYQIANDVLAPSCRRRGLEVRRCLVLYLAALSASNSSSNGGMATSALPAVLECASTAKKLGLRTILSKISVLKSKLQLERGYPLDALRQLDLSLPNILAHCNSKMQGDAHLCRARCLLSMASQGISVDQKNNSDGNSDGTSGTGGGKQKKLSKRTFMEVEQALIDALDGYSAMNDLKGRMTCNYLKARLYDSMDMVTERNFASVRFMKLSEIQKRNMRCGDGEEDDLLSIERLELFMKEWS